MKTHFLSQRSSVLAHCIFVILVCFSTQISFRAEAQTFTVSPTPAAIPKNEASGAAQAEFGIFPSPTIPPSTSLALTVDITDVSPKDMVVRAFPLESQNGTFQSGEPVFVLWDHERLFDASNNEITHIRATARLPFAGNDGIYTVQVIDDTIGPFLSGQTVGTFNSASLTINPLTAVPPTVSLFGGTQNQAVPAQINFGQPLVLVAQASGNPISSQIDRLGIVISGPALSPTPNPSPSPTPTPPFIRSPEVFQAPSSNTGATLTYTPPILAPGAYQISARAIDRAGSYTTVAKNLKVIRLFGLFSVLNLSSSVDANGVTSFSAQLMLENDTSVNSPDLRVRLVEVATGSFVNLDGPPILPPPAELGDPIVVSPLPAGTHVFVAISGTVQAFIEDDFSNNQFPRYTNFHVYAVLDEFINGAWTPVDSLKVIDGVQNQAQNFGGPGGGVNDPPPSFNGTSFDPFVLKSVAISGPGTVNDGAQAAYVATATARNSTGASSAGVTPTWSASKFTINRAGLFQAGHVNSNTTVNITATYTLGGVTKTVTKPVTIKATASSRLLNISTRLRVLNGDNVLIGGFIITGDRPKKVLLRAIGPSLSDANPPVPEALADPVLELHKPNGTVVTNDNWKDSQQAAIEATGANPKRDKEAALIATLAPLDPAVPGSGAYTAVVSGKDGGTGIGLVEAYDLDETADSRLANISTRGFVDSGDNVMIGGVIIAGTTKVLVRAIGPSLTNAQPPVSGALLDPTLELRNKDGALVTFNDDWKDTQQAAIEATMTQPKNDKESAIVRTLAPGNYTAIVRGKQDTTGVALVEIYNLP